MSSRLQVSNKRKNTPTTSVAEQTPQIEDEDFDSSSEEEEEETLAASRASEGRTATSASRILARVMGANLKSPPPAVAATPTRASATTTSYGSSSRTRAVQSPQVQPARSPTFIQAIQNSAIENNVSPSAVAQMSFVASPQAMNPPLPIQDDAGLRQSPPPHFVAAIPAQGD